VLSIPDKNYHYKPLKVKAFFLLPSQIKSIPVPHIYALDKTCLLADYLHQLILGGYLRVTNNFVKKRSQLKYSVLSI